MKFYARWPRKPATPAESGLGLTLLGGKVLERTGGWRLIQIGGSLTTTEADPTAKQGFGVDPRFTSLLISHVLATKENPSSVFWLILISTSILPSRVVIDLGLSFFCAGTSSFRWSFLTTGHSQERAILLWSIGFHLIAGSASHSTANHGYRRGAA
jgi:hypothetical protein